MLAVNSLGKGWIGANIKIPAVLPYGSLPVATIEVCG